MALRLAQHVLASSNTSQFLRQCARVCVRVIRSRWTSTVASVRAKRQARWQNYSIQFPLQFSRHEAVRLTRMFTTPVVHLPRLHSFDEYAARGLRFLEAQDFMQAERDFTECIALEKHNPRGYFMRSEVYRVTERYDQAINDLLVTLQKDPKLVPAMANLAWCYTQVENFQSALEWYDKALSLDRNYADALGGRADVHAQLNNNAAARADYEALLRTQPSHPEGRLGRAMTDLNDGRIAQAIEELRKLIKDQPKNFRAYATLGDAFFLEEKYDEAEREYNAALSLLDDSSVKNDAPPRVLERFEVDYRAKRAFARTALGNMAGALADASIALSKQPTNTIALLAKGHALQATEKYEEAIKTFETYLGVTQPYANHPEYANQRQQVQVEILECEDRLKAGKGQSAEGIPLDSDSAQNAEISNIPGLSDIPTDYQEFVKEMETLGLTEADIAATPSLTQENLDKLRAKMEEFQSLPEHERRKIIAQRVPPERAAVIEEKVERITAVMSQLEAMEREINTMSEEHKKHAKTIEEAARAQSQRGRNAPGAPVTVVDAGVLDARETSHRQSSNKKKK